MSRGSQVHVPVVSMYLVTTGAHMRSKSSFHIVHQTRKRVINLSHASAQSVQRLATGCTVLVIESPGGGEIFCTHPDWSWDPPSLQYDGYRVSFPGLKQPGRCVSHPLPSSAEAEERVELYVFSPSVPSWPVPG